MDALAPFPSYPGTLLVCTPHSPDTTPSSPTVALEIVLRVALDDNATVRPTSFPAHSPSCLHYIRLNPPIFSTIPFCHLPFSSSLAVAFPFLLFSLSLPTTAMAPKVDLVPLYFGGKRWVSSVSGDDIKAFRSKYRIPPTIVLEIPRGEHVVNPNSRATRVALFQLMFANGLCLPFCRPVLEVLHYLGLASSKLHPNAWRLRISNCINFRMIKTPKEYQNLTAREFLFTYHLVY